MSWKAYLDGNLFFSTATNTDSVRLSDIQLDLIYGEAGSATFVVPPQNTAYGSFNRLTSMVSIQRDGEELFYGRVYGVDGSFDTTQTITCEGILAALGDTIIEPFTHNSDLSALILAFLEEHNSKSNIQFNLGNIEIEDDYVYRAYEVYETTKSRLEDLVDSYGGYLDTHRDDDGNIYLDWYEDAKGTIDQGVEFGSNLADLVQESTADDLITCLYAFGATETDDDGNETTVDLSSVTDGGVLYIINEDAVADFGYIWGTKTWENVTLASNLYTKATAYLNEVCQPQVTITATAVDLTDAGYDLDHFTIGYYVPVISEPHGIEGEDILCMEMVLHPLDPTSGTLSLGTTIAGYTKTASANQKSTVKEINEIKANYATGEALQTIQETVITNTSLIDQSSDEILALVQQIVELGDQITTTQAQIELLSDQITLMVSADDLSTWIQLTSEYLLIGQSGSDIHSEQDNDSYCFVDASGNVLLRITANSGVDATTLNASEQITLKTGINGDAEWAIRLGAEQDDGHHNLNIVYVGGE